MKLRNGFGHLSQMSVSDLFSVIQEYLPLKMLEDADERCREWPVVETMCTFLRQVLNPGQPCREAVRASNIARIAAKRPQVSNDTSAYCQARRKLPENILEYFWKYLADKVNTRLSKTLCWQGLNVAVVDGSCLSMPDTPLNQEVYPQPSEQKKGCGFPVMKIVGVFSLFTGAIHAFAKGNLRTPERTLFRSLWDVVVAGFDLIIGDRGFCSFADMYLLKQAGVDSAFRLHQGRHVDWRKGKRLGKHDRLVEWKKPSACLKWLTPKQYADLPDTWTVRIVKVQIQVRGFRTHSLIIATTLLDSDKYSAADIADLYEFRWSVELFIRYNKTTMRMDILRCLSPETIHREIHMHWIAYNLARTIAFEAAQTGNVPISRISFKGTLDTLRQWLPILHSVAKQPRVFRRIYRAMLLTIANDPVPLRPNRSEPRAVKRRPKKFHLMNKPRHLMGNLPHQNRLSKKVPTYA